MKYFTDPVPCEYEGGAQAQIDSTVEDDPIEGVKEITNDQTVWFPTATSIHGSCLDPFEAHPTTNIPETQRFMHHCKLRVS